MIEVMVSLSGGEDQQVSLSDQTGLSDCLLTASSATKDYIYLVMTYLVSYWSLFIVMRAFIWSEIVNCNFCMCLRELSESNFPSSKFYISKRS